MLLTFDMQNYNKTYFKTIYSLHKYRIFFKSQINEF